MKNILHNAVRTAINKKTSRFVAAYNRQLEFVEPTDDFWFNMLQDNDSRGRGKELIEFFFPCEESAKAATLADFALCPFPASRRIKYTGAVEGVMKRWLTGIEPAEYPRAGLCRDKVPA